MKRGFTLIEVLIVVIILGILATIAVPQFGKIVEKARGAEVGTNVAAIQTGAKIYYLEKSTYAACSGSAIIDASYGITIKEKDWTFTTDASGNITAIRSGGGTDYSGKTVIFNKDVTVTAGTWPFTDQFK